jgi:hypothetical protein
MIPLTPTLLLRQKVNRPKNHNGLNNHRSYDALMADSGGKDSTYIMIQEQPLPRQDGPSVDSQSTARRRR